jgi:threonine efflux protein
MDTFLLLLMVAGLQIAGAAIPGPNFILISSYSTNKSVRHALSATIGIVSGILIWSSLALVGLGALISSSPTTYSLVQYLGAGYLIWLGASMIVSTFRSKGPRNNTKKKPVGSSAMAKGFLVNLGNPKTIAYYTSLFAALVPAETSGWVLVAIVITDALACAAWWTFVAFLFGANPVKQFFRETQHHINRAFGGALILLGLKLALNRN